MGSSMMLKIKCDQVIKEHNLPIETEHGNLDSINGFNGDLVITMSDLTEELSHDSRVPSAVGITNIVNKGEITEKLTAWVQEHDAKEASEVTPAARALSEELRVCGCRVPRTNRFGLAGWVRAHPLGSSV